MFLSDYNIAHGHVNGYQINEFVNLNRTFITDTVRSLNHTIPTILSKIYYVDVIAEWMEDNVYAPFRKNLEKMDGLSELAKIKKWSRRPYT